MPLADLVAKLGLDITNFQEKTGGALDLLDGLGKKFAEIGASTTTLIAIPLVALGTAAFEAGEQFEAAFNSIIAKTGATGTELDGLKASFETVFTSVPTDADTAAMAISSLTTKLHLTGVALTDLATELGKLSAFTGTNLGTLADSAASSFKNWHVETDDQSAALEYLNTVAQTFGISVGALSSSMAEIGNTSRLLGISWNDAANSIGFFAAQGISAGEVFDGLQKAFKTLKDSGIDPAEISLNSIVTSIQSADVAGNGLEASMQLLGTRGGAKMYQVIHDNADILDKLNTNLTGTKGSIDDTFTATESFGRSLTLLKNNLEALLAPLGGLLLNVLTGTVNILADATKGFEDLLATIKIYITLIPGYDAAAKVFKDSDKDWDITTNATRLSAEELAKYVEAFKGLNDTDTAGIWPSLTEMANANAAATKTASDNATVYQKNWDKVLSDIVTGWNDEAQADKDAQTDLQNHIDLMTAFQKIVDDVVHPAIKGMTEDTDKLVTSLGGMDQAIKDVTASQNPAQVALFATQQALIDLGVKPQSDLEDLAVTAQTNFDLIVSGGTASAGELLQAQKASLDAWAAYEKSTYGAISTDTQSQMDALNIAMGTKISAQQQAWDTFGTGISKTMSKCSDDIIDGLFTGKLSFGKVAEDFFKGIAKSFTDAFITPVTTAIGNLIAGALADLLGGKGFGGILDSIKAIGTAATGAFSSPSVGGGGGGGFGGDLPIDDSGLYPGESGYSGGGIGGAGGAIGSVTGIIGAVGSVATAVSSIVGNFQTAHLNNTINAMEQETARMAIYLGDQAGNSIQYYTGKASETLTYVQHRLEDIKALLTSGGGIDAHLSDISYNTFWSLKKFDDWHPVIMGLGTSFDALSAILTDLFEGVKDSWKTASNILQQINSSVLSLQPAFAGGGAGPTGTTTVVFNITAADPSTIGQQIVDKLRLQGVIK